MSYSRWSDSHWYTYYDCSSGYTKDTQRFNICSVITYTYKELKEDIHKCLKEVSEIENLGGDSKKILDELREYMEEFIDDVDNGNYFKIKIDNEDYDIISDTTSWGSYCISEDRWKFYTTDKIIKQIKNDIDKNISIKDEEILRNIIDEQKMLMELDK